MRRPRNSDEKPRKRPGRNLPARAGTGSPPEQSASQTAVTREQMAARDGRRPVNLALQGGGAHGAFTWGVLDRLLEDDSLALDAISATSAGAMNAVVMAHGVARGGRKGGRAKLAEFWQAVSEAGALFSPSSYAPWQRFLPGNTAFQESSAALALQAVANMWSPYQFNPFDLNPLKDVLRRVVDFDHLQKSPHATRLFINATNVRSGKVRIFENPEITLDAVLASACLPNVFKAVEIDGEHYWDGGFMGNPALFPLFYRGASEDIVIVHINPIERSEVPTTAPDILDRTNEISFNAVLLAELRAIAFVARLREEGAVDATRYKHIRVHSIRDEAEMSRHGAASKFDTDWEFLTGLRDAGRRAAEHWLARDARKVGIEGSIDLSRFL